MIAQEELPLGESIQAAFARFDAENPEVYELLVRFARELHERGWERAGIALVWERMRWEVHIRTNDPDFKLNNNFRSRYARLIMHREPDLAGFFQTRHLRRA